jgi:uncharacterized membrane protein YphA (DoxX/SURF4 family)
VAFNRSLFEWVTLVARLILGCTLLIAGLLKIGNLESMTQSVYEYQILKYISTDPTLLRVVAYPIPVIEIIIGALLIAGLFTRAAGLLGAAMMLVFIAAIASVWARGISIDCGCFGKGGKVAAGQTTYLQDILRDAGLMACGLWAAWKPKCKLSVDRLLAGTVEPVEEESENG